jgi:DNA-binding SARP family transcriptional activator
VKGTALARYRQPLLSSTSLAGFPAFQEWVELERAALHGQWREAALTLLSVDSLKPSQAVELCQTSMTADPLDDEALAHQLRCLVELGRASDARRLFSNIVAAFGRNWGSSRIQR